MKSDLEACLFIHIKDKIFINLDELMGKLKPHSLRKYGANMK